MTVYFWIIKVLTTGMGETTSDFLVHRIDPYVAVVLGAVGLVAALVLQFGARRYSPWIYWFAVVMVSVVGTMAADVLHVVIGIPYIVSTMFYAVVLAAIFISWYRREKTLSVHNIYTKHREAFYWAAILATFAFGTAAGDMTAMTLGWGYLYSGVLFAVVIAVPALAYWKLGWNEIFAFWFAYITTRPLGASFADWMGKPRSWSGLGWGEGRVSIAWAVVIVAFVGYLALSKRDVER